MFEQIIYKGNKNLKKHLMHNLCEAHQKLLNLTEITMRKQFAHCNFALCLSMQNSSRFILGFVRSSYALKTII